MRSAACLLVVVFAASACAEATQVSSRTSREPPSEPIISIPVPEARAPESLLLRLQDDLERLGFLSGPPTLEFDEPTAEAITALEEKFGLPEDGFYDLEVAALLDLARGRAVGSSVWALQSALGTLGYYDGSLDGAYNLSLSDAVRGLQSAAGLAPTGEYGEETAAVLLTELAERQLLVDWVFGPRPAPVPAPEPPPPEAPALLAVQQRLADLGFRPGPIDGSTGPETRAAIMAFQKREGIRVDGVAGPETAARLGQPRGEGPRSGLPVPRIEIDLGRQIAFVVTEDGSVATLAVSTGNGERYTTESGGTAVAHTPVGTYSILRVIDGVREAPLGTLYRPLYFRGGWAIHGSGHVPAYPASHGCVRVNRWDQDWLFGVVGIGTTVVIYDGVEETAPADAAPGA